MEAATRLPRRGMSLHERELIDAAIAEGRVTIIPEGRSAFDLPKWDAKQKALVGGDTVSWKEQSDRSYAARVGKDAAKNAPNPHMKSLQERNRARGRQRRATMWAMHVAGKKQKEIAEAMATSIDNVSRNLTRYRKENGSIVRAAE